MSSYYFFFHIQGDSRDIYDPKDDRNTIGSSTTKCMQWNRRVLSVEPDTNTVIT